VDEKYLYILVLEPLLTTAKQFHFIHSGVWKEKSGVFIRSEWLFSASTWRFPHFQQPLLLITT